MSLLSSLLVITISLIFSGFVAWGYKKLKLAENLHCIFMDYFFVSIILFVSAYCSPFGRNDQTIDLLTIAMIFYIVLYCAPRWDLNVRDNI